MRNAFRLLVLVTIVSSIAILPVSVQPARVSAQGSGGIIIEGIFGSGPKNFSPIMCSDTACQRIYSLAFPALLGVNPDTGVVEKGTWPAALATDWTISDDGLTYTFMLRKDYQWSDGTPITAKDIAYVWTLTATESLGSPQYFLTDKIAAIEAKDDYTVEVKLKAADCTAFTGSSIAALYAIPAHVYSKIPIDQIKDSIENTSPTVTGGAPFLWGENRPGERTSLVRNPNFPDAKDGVKPEGFIYLVVPDQTVLIERFLAGDTNVIDNPAVNRRSDIIAAGDKGALNVYNFPGNAWDYFAMNLADPTKPQSAVDKDGKPIDQGKHPIFGDPKVREALALAINVDDIIKGAVFGQGTRMPSFVIPASWAYDKKLTPLPFDPEQAKKLLDEAGWTVGADGIREKDGKKFKFELLTNKGNTRREAVGTIVKDELKQIGVDVDFQPIDFNVVLDRQNAQDFDAIILGWRQGFPDDPDPTQLFTLAGDVIGSGNNFVSYNNEEFNKLTKEALTLKGCALADRAALYAQLQAIIQKDLPYVPLYSINGMYAANVSVEGFDPRPSQLYWNVHTWLVTK